MERLKFIRPTKEYEGEAFRYIKEFNDYNSQINGVGGLNRYIGDYDGWLEKLERDRTMAPTSKKVPAETFFLIRERDNKLLGTINIRLTLNDTLLERGGNIGYGIRPTERRKGYNSYQLYCALKFCQEKGIKKVLITCDKDNEASAKSIQSCGGVLENEIIDNSDGKLIQRYWIMVDEAVKKGQKKYEKSFN